MQQYREYTRITGNSKGAQACITQQGAAQTLIVIALVYRKAAQQQHRQRIGHVATHGLQRGFVADRAGRQGVVPDDISTNLRTNLSTNLSTSAEHKAARCARGLVFERALFEPRIQRGYTAVEIV